MPFEFGDVVLVPFPFTNQMTSKQRPAVIVSQRAYARARPDVVLMAHTESVLWQSHANRGCGLTPE